MGYAMKNDKNKIQKLFSYGTLQYENVQLETFGRKIEGSMDKLPGYLLKK